MPTDDDRNGQSEFFRLGLVIKKAEQALMTEKTRVLREFGLTVPQYAALYSLSATPQASAAQLARVCLVTPQSMATVLENLESKGLITRIQSPMHHRVREIRLTEEGSIILHQADARALAVEHRLADSYTPEEQQTLRENLERAIATLQRTED